MNWTIHKYEVLPGVSTLPLPKGSEFLSVQPQHSSVFAWFRVDKDETEISMIEIAVVGTGHPAPPPDEAVYRGTFQLRDGSLVFHMFTKH